MRNQKLAKLRGRKVENEGGYHPRTVDPDKAYCYCDAWNLAWPHYFAEHTVDHEDAQRLRSTRAEGAKQ